MPSPVSAGTGGCTKSTFELAGDLPVEVGFVVTEDEADRFLAHLSKEKLNLFFIRVPVEMGFTNGTGVAHGQSAS